MYYSYNMILGDNVILISMTSLDLIVLCRFRFFAQRSSSRPTGRRAALDHDPDLALALALGVDRFSHATADLAGEKMQRLQGEFYKRLLYLYRTMWDRLDM